MKAFFKYWLPVLFWAGLIFFASSIPADEIPGAFSGFDILFHFSEYAVLAVLLSLAIRHSKIGHWGMFKRMALVMVCCLIYALGDELHQQFVAGRDCSTIDIAVDSCGIFLGSIICRW